MYATLDEFKQFQTIENTDVDTKDDQLITQLLTSVSAAIDTHCRRTFAAAADTTRTFDSDDDAVGSLLYLDHDLASLTSVIVDGIGVDMQLVTTKPRNERPIYALGLLIGEWSGTINVVGRWAFSVAVPHDVKLACLRWAVYAYKLRLAGPGDVIGSAEYGQIVVRKGMPADVALLLAGYVSLV